eukprot:TRINITY_DN776_c0_g2_i1.p1 TRINITY_DN776_c0_g2~~TRINITY_DN776_c0_g2_i1.p1  ORF type:complete len:775 (-),score=150.13 TRINITY_DN776_c0_g2_i1:187-2511(-)
MATALAPPKIGRPRKMQKVQKIPGSMSKGKLMNPAEMEKKYADYMKAKSRQKPAWFWEYLNPNLRRTEDGTAMALTLHCNLCFKVFSASNPSRTAVEHLKEGACKGIGGARETMRQGGIVVKPRGPSNKGKLPKVGKARKRGRPSGKAVAEDGEEPDEEEDQLPQTNFVVANKEIVQRQGMNNQGLWANKVNAAPTQLQALQGVVVHKSQKEKAMEVLTDWIYESAGAVPLSSVEHPKFREFLRVMGLPQLTHKHLATERLEHRYVQTKQAVDQKIAEARFFQLVTNGWSDCDPGEGPRLISVAVNLSSGATIFRKVMNPETFPLTSEFIQERLDSALLELVSGEQGYDRCVGIITDGDAALRSALQRLSDSYPQMVNVTCQSQAFRELLQDFRELIPCFHTAIEGATRAVHFFTQRSVAKQMLVDVYQQVISETKSLRMLRDASLEGPLEMVEAVLACKEALQYTVEDARFAEAFPEEAEDMQSYFGQQKDFWWDAEFAITLAQPIREAIHSVDTERPSLSQCLPLWNSVRARIKEWTQSVEFMPQNEGRDDRLLDLLDRRFQQNYHAAWAVSYLLDPLYAVQQADRCLPPYDQLTVEQKTDVDRLLPKLVAREDTPQVMLELVRWRAEGFPYLYGEGLHKKERDPLTGKDRGVSARTRTMIWETILQHLPHLGRVAARLMTLRASSLGSEQSWQVWKWGKRGDLRSWPAIERAAKIAVIASNSKAEGRGPRDDEGLQGELDFDEVGTSHLGGYLQLPPPNGLQQLVSGPHMS